MGQDEDALPLVRRADFCRTEQARRRRVTHCPKLSQHGFKAETDVPGDILNEDPFGVAFADDTGDLGPEVPGIVGTAAFASGAERLAGISGEDDVEGTAEGVGIEAMQVVPDRRGREISCALGGDEDGAGPVLPVDKCAGVETGLGEHKSQIKASAACAEGQSVPGT
ncbi:hypothetical protein [Pseudosulfitobacter sp. DSM 107133]|uniref:hypothetical protein n=1 Tax=Pseudosulfitobacter sp. DSM 107133 TaxID=2883100 RepID=UPI001F080DB0|nr:hypothetical protein [Pseudosulfitobacter sp. DSM 107133]UOA28657.1 hypothetical protein DSM107133_03407 [Pseudosulfitobacter sp. DSM 107133]